MLCYFWESTETQRIFIKYGNKHYNAKNFILVSFKVRMVL